VKAHKLIGILEKTRATLCPHGATRCDASRIEHGEPHVERECSGFTVCTRCGYVKAHNGWRGTCIGRVNMELRAGTVVR
jgi:hypothetical protein